MYSNVPTGEILDIIDLLCGQQSIEEKAKNDLSQEIVARECVMVI
jgi:hypothetical protein